MTRISWCSSYICWENKSRCNLKFISIRIPTKTDPGHRFHSLGQVFEYLHAYVIPYCGPEWKTQRAGNYFTCIHTQPTRKSLSPSRNWRDNWTSIFEIDYLMIKYVCLRIGEKLIIHFFLRKKLRPMRRRHVA